MIEITDYDFNADLYILKGKQNKHLYGTYPDMFRRSVGNCYSIR